MSSDAITGYRLSAQQRRIWLLQGAGEACVTHAHCLVEGLLDAPALRRAALALVERHEILRTTFRQPPGMRLPLQVVGAKAEVAWRHVDLAGLDDAARDAAAGRAVSEAVHAAWAIGAGPSLRVALVRLAPERHELTLALPSLCADAATLELLLRELAAAYADGGGQAAAAERVQYAQYSEWQLGLGEEDPSGARHWRERLGAAQASPRLAFELPRGAAAGARACERARLDASALAAAGDAAHRLGVEPGIFLLACWAALVWRHGGAPEFAVATPLHGRGLEDVADLPGAFAAWAPIVCRFTAEARFESLLRGVADELRQAETWQDSFAADEAGAGAAVAFDDTTLPAPFSAAGLRFTPVEASWEAERFALRATCARDDGGAELRLRYDLGRFHAADVRRLAAQFDHLLRAAAARPETPLARLELLGDAGRARVAALAAGPALRVAPQPVHARFEACAAAAPDSPAVVCGERRLSYGQLDAQARRLAQRLRSVGVGPESRVVVCLERTETFVAALLGVWKAGGAYVAMEPSQPARRAARILEACAPAAIVTEAPLAADWPATRVPVIDARAGETDGGTEAAVAAPALAPENLAYVMFTSGSTGAPKGVAIEHRQLANYVDAVTHALGLGRGESFASVSSFAADLGLTAVLPALCHGGCLHVIPEERVLDAEALAGEFSRHAIDWLKIVPGHWAALNAGGESARVVPRRGLVLGGEALAWDVVRRVESAGTACRVWNHYGPTETTVGALTHGVSASPRDPRSATVPLGRPLANVRAYVLDAELRALPEWVPGEVGLAGAGVARGYVGRPDVTAERFVPDPFGAQPGERLYRTGDLARRLPDGGLEYLGRIDEQLKIRGFRVETGEIEAALREHAAVERALVTTRASAAGDKRLVAYVVARRPFPASEELRRFVGERLPEFMVPFACVPLERLPLTANGKVDRAALPEPDETRESRAHVAPRTLTEELVAGIWADVLGREQIGVEDGFFDLGGHSLMATRVVSRIRECFRIELPLRTLFHLTTVAALAQAIDAARAGGSAAATAPIVPRRRDGALPLSFSQQRFWFLDQLEPGNPYNNSRHAARLTGNLDRAALERALGEVVRRHEALRTRFPLVDGRPVQEIVAPWTLTLEPLDLSALPEAQREPELQRLLEAERREPFDLVHGPVFRVRLLRMGPSDHVLVFTTHHVASDGWSMGILIRETAALYKAFVRREPSPLAEPSLQYADFAVWQRAWLQGEVLDAEVAYWRRQLAGAPVLELPADRVRPARPSLRSGSVRLDLPSGAAARLHALGRRESATLFMVLLAGFKALLGRYAGSDDVSIGVPVAGRNRAEIESLCGFFLNTLVLRSSQAGDPAFVEYLRRVRDVAVEAYAHQDLPFDRLVEELQPKRDLSRTPLFQILFVFQNLPTTDGQLEGLSLSALPVDSGWSNFDLTLWVSGGDTGLGAVFEYNVDLFEHDTITRLAAHFGNLLEDAAAEPRRRLSELRLMSPDERDGLLTRWNDTAAEYPRARLTHELISEQAARTPEAPALWHGERMLTYRQLDQWTDGLARALVARGVGRGSVVALLAERGFELLGAVLAVFKAGAAYLPLDPRHPAPRQRQLMERSGAAVLLAGDDLVRVAATALETLSPRPLLVPFADLAHADAGAGPPARRLTPRDLAYVIYTSGSTGQPKGAMLEHQGMLNHLYAKIRDLDLTAADVVAQTASQCFDISVWQMLAALVVGGGVRIFSDNVAHDPQRLMDEVARDGVTVLETVPSLMRAVCAAPAGAAPPDLSRLRWLIPTGEALPPELARRWLQLNPGVPLVNAYGPTECSDDVAHCAIFEPPAETVLYMPIGRAVINTRLYVVDAGLQPTPLGIPGELCVGGEGVGRGYLHDPARTAEVFVPDPFGRDAGARLYRTGDRVRLQPDGNLVFLGRADDQVKIRGFRIELGEIEAVLARHASVREALVLALDHQGDKRLVAYVVPRDQAPPVSELRGLVKACLPDYMVPSAFVTLERMPLNDNGKVDRKALAALESRAGAAQGSRVAPRTETERELAAIWARVLGHDDLGVEDDFFEIGGHSLLATQVSARILEVFQVELPLRTLFEHPTVAALATAVEEAQARQRGSEESEILALLGQLSDDDVAAELHRRRNA
jgi:amino acid adenylation domain-containing protein